MRARRILRLAALPVVAVLLLTAVVALGVRTLHRADGLNEVAAREAPAFNDSTAAAQPTRAAAPSVTVISDDFTAPARNATPVPVWPLLLERRLGVEIVPLGVPGAGYTIKPRESEFGGTFPALAPYVAPSSKLVILFGGANDYRARPSALRTAAQRAISRAKDAAPDASVVVIGPATTSDTPSDSLLAVRDTLKTAARAEDVRFVDPLAAGWLAGPGMLRSDQTNLSEKAQVTLANRIEPIIRRAVAAK